MIAAAVLLAPSLLACGWLLVAAVLARETSRPAVPFALAYAAPADVGRFLADGWHVVGQDPRYGSVILRRDAEDVTAPAGRTVLGRGA